MSLFRDELYFENNYFYATNYFFATKYFFATNYFIVTILLLFEDLRVRDLQDLEARVLARA